MMNVETENPIKFTGNKRVVWIYTDSDLWEWNPAE
jgi:hypothetical protein